MGGEDGTAVVEGYDLATCAGAVTALTAACLASLSACKDANSWLEGTAAAIGTDDCASWLPPAASLRGPLDAMRAGCACTAVGNQGMCDVTHDAPKSNFEMKICNFQLRGRSALWRTFQVTRKRRCSVLVLARLQVGERG